MTIHVRKVADLIDSCIVISGKNRSDSSGFGPFLTSLEEMDPDQSLSWKFDLVIGEGSSARKVTIPLPPIMRSDEYAVSASEPIFLQIPEKHLSDYQYAFFQGKFYLVQPMIRNSKMEEEAVMRIKKDAYNYLTEISSLKSFVANMEATISYQSSGIKREPIPDDVKLLVWARDGGTCTRCGSNQQMHFDHIIPVAKGGSNIAENIQLLCQTCNLRKSYKIAF